MTSSSDVTPAFPTLPDDVVNILLDLLARDDAVSLVTLSHVGDRRLDGLLKRPTLTKRVVIKTTNFSLKGGRHRTTGRTKAEIRKVIPLLKVNTEVVKVEKRRSTVRGIS